MPSLVMVCHLLTPHKGMGGPCSEEWSGMDPPCQPSPPVSLGQDHTAVVWCGSSPVPSPQPGQGEPMWCPRWGQA